MGRDKTTIARELILDMLDSGVCKAGDKLPGAREIASRTGMSLLMAQAAVKTLERDGILEAIPSSGSYVKKGWEDIALDSNLAFFDMTLPWIGRFERRLKKKFPGLRLCRGFKRGMIELRTTITVLSGRGDYADLSGVFKEAFPDSSVFYGRPFESFSQNGRLIGVPFIFSPRVVIYNPELFKAASCPEPRPGWTWDDFISTIRTLKKSLPPDRIFNFSHSMQYWMSFVFLAGGALFDPDSSDPVRIDSPQTRRGLSLYRRLQSELGVKDGLHGSYANLFSDGKLAMMLMPREVRTWFGAAGFDSWNAVPLPSVKGGSGMNSQATDLICVRRECRDWDAVLKFVRFMLSEDTQDFIGSERYGIPIRKSSALKSLDDAMPGDKVFFDEMDRMSAEYNLDSPELSSMIYEGIERIWREPKADIDAVTGEIASAIRTYLKVKSYANRM